MMSKCPLPFFLPFLAVISFRKKKESEDFKEDLVTLPSPEQKMVPSRQPVQASEPVAPAPKDDEKIKAVNATVTDLKGQVESLSMQGKTLKGDIDSMKGDLGSINDSMKALLQVYEMVSRQYNPFVENTLRNNDMEQMSIPMKKPTEEEPQDFIMRPQDSFEAVPLAPQRQRATEFDPYERPKQNGRGHGSGMNGGNGNNGNGHSPNGGRREQQAMDARMAMQQPREMAPPSIQSDNYCFNQVHKIVEYHMNRIYMQRMNGAFISDEDYDELDHWLAELRRLEVR